MLRGQQKRGPRAAGLRVVEHNGTHRSFPEGGYGSDESSRHLINYHRQIGDSGENDVYYNATRSVVVAARRWRKLANERVKAVGQTMARWETLFLVAFSGSELTQSELARLISVEGPTMVRMLDVLARDGLIERSQSQADRRVTINRITPAGLKVIAEIMGITNALRNEVLSEIEPERLAICVDVLGEILGRLDALK
jgi:MarR family transcriptional regulator for hemolysin